MSRMALALVGLGKIARDQHLPSLAASDAFSLVATVDPRERLPDLPAYADLTQALDAHPQIRAVALCTPPAVRAPLARLALQRGCHVLLEKPPCVLSPQLDALRELAARHRVSLFAAWHSRFAAAVETARGLLRTTPIRGVRASWKEDHRVWHPGQDWLWRDGGFGVLDPGINALSILTHILPAPLTFVAAELDCPPHSAMPVAAHIALSCAGIEVALELDFQYADEACWNIAVDTADARLMLSQGGAQLSMNGERQYIPAQREYAAVYTHFAELIGRGTQDADGQPLAIAEAVLQRGKRRVAEFL